MKKLLLLFLLSPALCAQVQIGKNVQIGGGGSGSGCSETVCVVNSPASTQTVTQPSGTTLAVNSLNRIINAGSSLSAAITACGSANTTIQITQTIAVGSGITVPRNCPLLFQSGGNLTGTSITFAPGSSITAPPTQIFGSTLAVTGLQLARPEWWGVTPYATRSAAASGTNDLTASQLGLNSITAGGKFLLQCAFYRIGGMVLTKNTVEISADCPGGNDGGTSTQATIVDTSSSETILALQGTSPSVLLLFATLKNIALQRTTLPTSTAKGLSVEYVSLAHISNVSSADSGRNFYLHVAGNVSDMENLIAQWGFSAVAGSSYTTGTVTGYYLDSADGNGESTLNINNAEVNCSAITAIPTTGLLATGTNISDFYTNLFAAGVCSHGIDLENTGTSNFVAQDIQIINPILNVCGIDCLKINGAGSSTDIAPHVFVSGGNMFATGTGAVGAFIENSSNISMSGVQVFAGAVGVLAQNDIVLNTVDGFQIINNNLAGESLINISCTACSHGTIIGNNIKNGNGTTGNVGIKNVGSTNVSIQGNTIAGTGGINLLTGISFDSTSSNNGPWSLNTIDTATVTTPVTDAGTNNNTLKPTILIAGNVTDSALTSGQCVQASTGGLLTTTGSACGSGGGAVSSVSNSDSTLTISPATGAVVASINLAHANSWTGVQTFTNGFVVPSGGVGTFNTGGFINANELNGTVLSGLATGILKNTTSTGVPSIAVAADFPTLNQNTTGTAANLSGTPALPNGTTATTQAVNDATAKLATDAFVVGQAGTATPLVDGTAAVGTSLLYARQDHVHPTDTSRAPLASPTFTGKVTTAASASGGAGLNLPHGTAPTSPVNGDLWTTTAGLFGRINSATNQFVMTASSLSISRIPVSNGGGSVSDSQLQENGAALTYFGVQGIVGSLTSTDVNYCPDTSGSGTAQICSTLATMTPVGGKTLISYTTTTTNSGASLTMNVNGIGAKPVAIPGASGWTTTLTAGIIPANKPLLLFYDGTNWNVQQTGTVSASGGITFPQTVGGTVNSGGIVYANSGTQISVSAAGTVGQFVLWGGAGSAPTGSFSVVPVANGGTGAATFAAHSFFGNPTGSTAAPAASLIGTNDWSPNAYVAGAGSVNVMTATLAPVATAYVAGLQVDVLPNLANTTTTPTLNVNGLGAKTITKCGTTALAAGDYSTTAVAEFVYDGTRMQLVNPQAVGCGSASSSITFPQTVGGTTNSGGVPYFSSATVLSSSAAGTAGDLMLWGGAGAAPTDAGFLATDVGRLSVANTWQQINTFVGILAGAATSGALNDGLTTYNGGTTTGTATGVMFQARNASFGTFKGGEIVMTMTTPTAGAEVTNMTISHWNAGAAQLDVTYSGAGNGVESGSFTAKHIGGSGTAPTIAAGTGAGSGPTVTSTLTSDTSGYVQVLTGTAPVLSASVFTITFGTTYATAPKCVLWPDNAITQALTGVAAVQIFDPSTTVATATSGATALVTATTYKWGYSCLQ